MYIDIHCHLDSCYYENIEEVIQNAKNNGVNKLIYNGMSINRIGTLREFVSQKPPQIDYGYYKGKLIRLEGIGDDFHMANTISSELNKGVYII